MRLCSILLVTLLAWLPFSAQAQEQAVLIADQITVDPAGLLRAEGNVEVLFQGRRLRASAITYNRARDQLIIEGPLSLSTGDDFVLLADTGALDADFQNGVLQSARLVLNQQLQLAAVEIERLDGRYTRLEKTVASTCPVCAESEVPLWQIRASEVIHDNVEQRLYFKNALFEVLGIPVFYVPRLQMPDPSVERATGFLVPKFKTSTILGTGAQLPYFIAIDDHSDALLLPYISRQTTTLGVRYRELFSNGAMVLNGALSDDVLSPDQLRGYFFGRGLFFLDNDYELGFDLELSSDDAYLFEYGISEQDRLRSDVELRRVRDQSLFTAGVIGFTSFRDDESSETIPSRIAEIDQLRRIPTGALGGQAELRLQGYGLYRESNADVTGRDYGRFTAGLGWRRDQVVGPGMLARAETQIDASYIDVAQDTTADSSGSVTAVGAAELRWPLARVGDDGATYLLEPAAQLVFSTARDRGIPNEESTLVEFDEGNLWSLDRLPGSSAYEIGNRLNAGVSWTRLDPKGWSASATLGRVIRSESSDQFNDATGLDGLASDWLIAGKLALARNLTFANRALIADDLSITRNDARFDWNSPALDIAANFLWHIAEPEVGRDQNTWELRTEAAYDFNANWVGKSTFRYDFVTDRMASAGLGLTYLNPCLTVDFGFLRNFTSSTAVEPKTDFTIALSVPQGAVASKRPGHCGG